MIQKDESLLKNWPLMSSIIVYCVFAIHDIAFAEVLLFLLKDVSVFSFDSLVILLFINLCIYLYYSTIYFWRFSHYGLKVLEG